MSLHFSLLAGQTLSSPFAHILTNVRPNELVCYGLASSFNSRMAETMDDVKYSSAIRQWYKWSSRSIGYVDEKEC